MVGISRWIRNAVHAAAWILALTLGSAGPGLGATTDDECLAAYQAVWDSVIKAGPFRIDAPEMVQNGMNFELIEYEYPKKIHLVMKEQDDKIETISVAGQFWMRQGDHWLELRFMDALDHTKFGALMNTGSIETMLKGYASAKASCLGTAKSGDVDYLAFGLPGGNAGKATQSGQSGDEAGADFATMIYADPTSNLPVQITTKAGSMTFTYGGTAAIAAPQ